VTILKLNKRLSSVTVKFLLPLLIVILAVQWIIPAIGIHFVKKWYAEQGDDYELTVGEWSFVPWQGFISLGKVKFRSGETLSVIKELKINVGVMDLLQRKVTIETLYFDGLQLNINNGKKGFSAVGLSSDSLMRDTAETNEDNQEKSIESHSEQASEIWDIEIQNIELINHRIGFAQPDVNISLEINDINITGKVGSHNLMIDSQVSLQTLSLSDQKIELAQPLVLKLKGELIDPFSQAKFKGDLQLSAAKFNTPWVSPAGFDQLALSGLDVSLSQQSLETLELTGLVVGKQLLKLKQYKINELSFEKNKLMTGLHEWAGLASIINLDEQGNIAGLTLPSANAGNTDTSQNAEKIETEDVATQDTLDHANEFELAILKIEQADNDVSTVHAINKHVNPNLNIMFKINEFFVSDINNQNQPMNIHFLSQTDEYSRVSLDAKAAFDSSLSGDVSLNIRQFDLISLSGYVEKAIGYHVNQGQLTLLMDLNINKGKLAGDGKLKILNSNLQPSDQATMNKISKQISMPIETALSLIKDDSNNIEMSIPITGDMNAPDFGVDDLVAQISRKALTAATLHYVKQAIFPYGLLVSVAGYVGDELFAISLTPLEYNGEEFDDEQSKYLNKVADLMLEKSTLQLRVCAQVSQKDADNEDWYAPALDKANKIKRYIVKQDPELAGRIVLCQPKIDEKTQIKMGF
jgi:hypothetical protein